MTTRFRRNRRPENGPKHPPKRDGLLDDDFDEDDDEAHPYHKLLDEDEAEGVLAAQAPKPGVYPKGISEEAKDVWDKVVRKHSKDIDSYEDIKEKWAAALAFFYRATKEAGVKPFDKAPKTKKDQNSTSEIKDIIESAKEKAKSEAEAGYQVLREAGFVQRLTKVQFDSVSEHKGRYYIKLVRHAILRKSAAPERALRELDSKGYKAGRKWAHKKISRNAEILWEANGDKLIVRSMIATTRDQTILFLGIEDDSKKADILKRLSKVARMWLRTGDLDPSRVSAALVRRGHNDLALAIARILGASNG